MESGRKRDYNVALMTQFADVLTIYVDQSTRRRVGTDKVDDCCSVWSVREGTGN